MDTSDSKEDFQLPVKEPTSCQPAVCVMNQTQLQELLILIARESQPFLGKVPNLKSCYQLKKGQAVEISMTSEEEGTSAALIRQC